MEALLQTVLETKKLNDNLYDLFVSSPPSKLFEIKTLSIAVYKKSAILN